MAKQAKQSVAVVDTVDVAVMESTNAGYALAYYLAQRGLKVALLSTGTSTGFEACSCLRPFAHGDEIDALPAPFAQIFDRALKREAFETVFFHVGRLTDGLEDLLLDSGVHIYYTAAPAGALFLEDRLSGVLVGGKYGLRAVLASTVVDCSPWASISHMAGATLSPRGNNGRLDVSYSFLCKQELPAIERISVTAEAGSPALVVTRGQYADVTLSIEADPKDPLTHGRISAAVRQKLLDVCRWVRKRGNLPQLDILRGAETYLPAPWWRLGSAASSPAGRDDFSLAHTQSADIANLYVFSQCADLSDDAAKSFHVGIHKAIYSAAEIARDLHASSGTEETEKALEIRTCLGSKGEAISVESLRFEDPGYVEPQTPRRSVEFPVIPVLSEADLLVVGAGTSGMPAARAAAQGGVDVICIEKHGDVGGTNTIGGVPTPWFGIRPPHFEELQSSLRTIKRESWVPAALAMADVLRESGVTLLAGLPVAGAYVGEKRIEGVLALTPVGPVALRGNAVIDGTGDGDLAGWAGVPYTYGTERDEATMWYAFGKYTDKRPAVSRQYLSIVDLRSLRDTSRSMMVARRQVGMLGPAEYPSYYLAPRESRHIRAAARLNYLDIFSERWRQDVVSLFKSNFDIKGVASSDLVMSGFIDREHYRNYICFLPYGAMVPDGMANLLVVGKAYNGSHDAFAMARMVGDLMCQGAAAGVAAELALGSGSTFPELDVEALQKKLLDAGLLRTYELQPRTIDISQALDAFLSSGDLKHIGRVIQGGEAALKLLKGKIGDTEGEARRWLGRALCCLGDNSANDLLLASLAEELQADSLPISVGKMSNKPNHGYAPEPAFTIDALALTAEMRLVEHLENIAERIKLPEEVTDSHFCYVHSVAYACERLADPSCVPALTQLLDVPQLHGRVLTLGDDPRKGADWVGERYAYLELCLARSLARCGDSRGYEVLIGYLRDMRLFLARSALMELRELTGTSFDFEIHDWEDWLQKHRGELGLKPLTRRFD
jgi:ribulose 1,5-bisphosphate synthetase/thiazole synthase